MTDLHVSPSIEALEREWISRYASATIVIDEIPTATGAELLELLRSDDGDAIFRALIRAAQQGRQDATRILLRAMRPSILSIATYYRRRNPLGLDASIDLSLSAMCGAIADYRVETWQSSAATNLTYRARKQMATEFRSAEHSVEDIPTEPDVMSRLSEQDDAQEPSSFQSIVFVLSWALDNEVLTRDEIRLMARWELGTPAERSAMSAELEVSQQTLRQRSFRLRRRIHDAVVDDLGAPARP